MNPDRPGKICPYHVAKDHIDVLRASLREKIIRKRSERCGDIPLFPDADGNTVSAEAMIALVDALAVASGEEVTNSDGMRRFGRHSWRSTGAVWLTGTMHI